MGIHTWRTPEEQERFDNSRPRRSKTYQEASEEQRRLIDLRKELKAEKRRQQLAAEKAAIWDWVASEGGINAICDETYRAAEWAQQMRKTQELRQEIQNQVLITEIDQAACETQMPRA